MIVHTSRLFFLLFFAASRVHAAQQGEEDERFIGGVTSVGQDLEEDVEPDRPSFLDTFKARLDDSYGLDVNADYAVLYQKADKSLSDETSACSGAFRLYGKWTLIGRGTSDTGAIIAKVEHRHRVLSDIAPADLPPNLGYAGVTGTAFSDVGGFLAPLYWELFFMDQHAGVVAGRLDPLDFVDLLGIGSQWTSFQNAAVLANLSMPLPDVGCGAGAGIKLSDQWVIGASLHDANGSQTKVTFLVDGSEFFKQAYVSWTPTRSKRFTNAFHLTFWHVDERETRGIEKSYGIAISGNWLFTEKWMPFVRAGWANGSAPLAEKSLTTGLVYNVPGRSDQAGVGVNWQDLSHRALDDQITGEVFYRWQVTSKMAFTPSAQVLHDPSLNPEENLVTLFSFRARVVF